MEPIIFIDFDGTLCFDYFWRNTPAHIHKKIQDFLFRKNKELVNDWMRGKHTSEDIHHILAQNISEDYAYLWDIFVSDCKTMRVEKQTLHTIQNLKKKYTIALVTDNMDSFTRFTSPALHIEKYFDYIFNSHIEKTLKTDSPSLFEKAFEQTKRTAENAVLIDNSKTDCNAFQKLGGKSCLVTKEKDITYWLHTL